MNEPTRTFTQAELVEAALVWVKEQWRGYAPRDKCDEVLGTLVDFVTNLVPKEDKPK